jgi:heme-degrading monooxygenase HmoA
MKKKKKLTKREAISQMSGYKSITLTHRPRTVTAKKKALILVTTWKEKFSLDFLYNS